MNHSALWSITPLHQLQYYILGAGSAGWANSKEQPHCRVLPMGRRGSLSKQLEAVYKAHIAYVTQTGLRCGAVRICQLESNLISATITEHHRGGGSK